MSPYLSSGLEAQNWPKYHLDLGVSKQLCFKS